MSWVQNNSHNHAPPPPIPQQPQQQQSSPPPAAAYFGKSHNNNNNNAINALNTSLTTTTGLNVTEDNYVNNTSTMSQYSNHNNNNGMSIGMRGAATHPTTGQQLLQSQEHHQSYANNAPNHLNNQQHISQQQNWQQQQTIQQQQQMPPMQPINNVVAPQTANNNWQNQNPQQQQQQHNQNLTNANVYQQQQHQAATSAPPTTKNWQKTAAPVTQQTSSYANYYAQPSADAMNQKASQRNYGQHESVNFFQQNTLSAPLATQQQHSAQQQQQQLSAQQQQQQHSAQQQQQQATAQHLQQHVAQQQQQQSHLAPQPPSAVPTSNDYFDNSVRSNNNNNANNSLTSSQTDGWSDWDWNDNSANVVNNEFEQQQQQQLPLPPQPEQQQQNMASPPQQQQNVYNSIEDSFSNDNWNWNVTEDQNVNQSQPSHKPATNVVSTPSTVQQIPLVNVPHLVAHSKPTTLPLPESVNDNYNELKGDVVATTTVSSVGVSNDTAPPSLASATSVTTSHNIPSSVYVSQAKPVARPTRQYASPPGGNTPTVELPHSALTPPHAFQNETEATSGIMQTTANPMAAQLPPTSLLPPTGAVSSTATTGGNPFKRAGVAQHHRAFGLLPTTASATPTQLGQQAAVAAAPASFNALPPPPPADFANPLPPPIPTNDLESAENAEDLHENQEVLAPPPPLPSVGMQQVSLMGGGGHNTIASPPPPPPPNDERNQYMQTSQLSENPDEELNVEADSLPPPGLSRLVLGQPEFAATQRQVTGTEEPNVMAVSMPIEERQADGEDTSDELATIQAPAASMPSTDRNLYLVPGESVNSSSNVQQRVVTGVEMGSGNVSNVNVTSPPSNEQREIVLDGENLNDPHQPQHQQQQQQQAVSRNEPPLEGAASGSEAPAPAVASAPTAESQNVSTPQQTSTKSLNDHSNLHSTGNDDESDAEQRYAYNKKSAHKQPEHSKSERQRKEKQRSVERYESEDSLEYSSERELERERERDRDNRRGGARSERDDVRDYHRSSKKQSKRAEKAPLDSDERKQRDKYYRGGEPARSERRSQRYQQRYDADSRYETEESLSRHETSRKDAMRRSMRGGAPSAGNAQPTDERSGGRSDRSDRDYDDYRQRYQRSSGKRDKDVERPRRAAEDDRRDPRRTRQRNERDDYDTTLERQRRRHYRGGPDPRVDPREYDEYRKKSSRNARDSDLEQERLRDPRDMRDRYDPRQAAMYAYPSAGYAYDPYTTYYYEQMARTNPQAYAELYKKYYGHAPPAGALGAAAGSGGAGFASAAGLPAVHQEHHSLNASTAGNAAAGGGAADGRESVHSGRSSAHNDKDRYTQAYISHANEYHQRHYQHHQQQQQLQQQQQQQYHYQMSTTLSNSSKLHSYSNGGQNMSMNSTMLEYALSGAYPAGNGGLYGGIGLSSARSTSNLSQISSAHGSYYGGLNRVQEEHERERDRLYYVRADYADSRSGHLSLRDVADPTANEPQRLTPAKFNSDHALVSFTSGILVTFKPRYTSHGHINNIVKLLRLNINDATRQVIQSFPGPLVRGLTHKKTIIEFCEEQIRLGPMHSTTTSTKQLLSTNVDKYRASYTLMWNLLILLLRQNGMVVGTDIAELLLKNQQQYPYQPNANQTPNLSATSTSRSTKSASPENDESGNDNSDIDDESNELLQNDDESAAQKESVASELSAKLESESKSMQQQQQEQPKQLSETEITEKFRNYLLYGNVNKALDWATDNNLWGHALFLASKVDRRLHANVMMKFANKLALNDPLQTLYQLMSGRTPSSVTSIQDEKWGDWRPHLSMILSNTSQKPELDRKAITTLGDSLFNRGDLFAAHFCYLMAQVGFGRYQENVVGDSAIQQNLPKLVLLGSSHYKPFHEFATTEAIIMTEIYEYACSLNDEKFSIVEFQPYKYLLAARLIDYGYHLKSLMYLEQTAMHVQRDPVKYETTLIAKIYELADRLKYYDPVLDKADDESSQNLDSSLNASGATHLEEQKWLQDLRLLAEQHKFDYQPGTSATTTPNTESYSRTVADNYQTQNQIDQQFMEINKQFNELNLQYANDTNVVTAAVPTFYNPDAMQQQQPEQTTAQQQDASLSQQSPTVPLYDPQQQQMQNYSTDPAAQQNLNQETPDSAQSPSAVDPYASYQQQYMQPLEQQQYQQNAYYDPTQQQQQQAQYGTEATEQMNIANQQQSYDYWAQQQQGQFGATDENAARPTISMPKSKTFDSDDEKQQAKQRQNNAAQQQQQGKKAQQEQQQQRGKNDAKDLSKSAGQANQNSGWFGGIWNKLSLKPKNQMILPDDKNPAIVWDPEKKRWINTDGGDDNNEESLKPPPKMSDIMPQSTPQQQQQLAAPTQFPGQPHQQQAQHQYQQQQQPMQQDAQLLQTQQHYAGMPATSPAAVPLHNTNTAATQPSNVPTSTGLPSSNYSAAAANAGTASDSNAPTKPPSLQSNMFKMQRNRTLKNSYVDVFNPSGKPASKEIENVLAPSLPPANVPQGGFFIPGAAPNDNTGYQQQQQQQQPQQQDTPQFYNPNQFAAGSGY